jgi:HEPN domain-containing protein
VIIAKHVMREALETFYRRYGEARACGHAHDAFELALQAAVTVIILTDPRGADVEAAMETVEAAVARLGYVE